MKNLTGGTFAIFAMLFVLFSSVAFANNGDGTILSYNPLAVSIDKDINDLTYVIKNEATSCIDEIIITAPDTWTGTAIFDAGSSSTNVVPIDVTNEADDGTYTGEKPYNQSLRLQLNPSQMLCPGSTATIVIDGLHSPASPENSEFLILTSDQSNNNPPSINYVRYPVQQSPVPTWCVSPREQCTNVIRVTDATDLKIEYLHIYDDGDSEGPVFTSTGFTGRAWGAWARLTELYVKGTVGGTADIYIESGQTAGLQTSGQDADILLDSCTITGVVVDTCTMDYSGWDPSKNVAGVMEYGFIADGSSRNYYIDGYNGTLTKKGHTDQARAPIPSNSETGLSGARGTILNVDNLGTGRQINVQLIDENGYDVLDDQIPIWFTNPTGLGHFADPNSPKFTTGSGNIYLTLLPDCAYGVETVVFDSPGLDPAIEEKVGINAGAPASFAVTEGDGADVIGGDNQRIEVTVYDACDNPLPNKITDSPKKPEVTFTLDQTCGNAFFSQNPSGVPSSDYKHQEQTSMGIADVYLVTDCTLCTHNVSIDVEGLGSTSINLNGVVGPPAKLKVTANTGSGHNITADQCIDATVEVTDACGNLVSEIPSEIGDEMEQWESIVRVSIENPLESDQWGYVTQIKSSDFREEEIYNSNSNRRPSWVQGKLNDGVGTVEICGCQGLGPFDIVAESDTIESGSYNVDVKNAPPSCIEVNVGDDELLQCQGSTNVDVAIKDVCGNYVIGQSCGSGPASSCVDLSLEGNCPDDAAHLSTDAVCVDLVSDGKAPTTTLYRDRTDVCCTLEVNPSDAQDCCVSDFPQDLPLCEQSNNKLTFIGEPEQMTTQFYKTRKVCERGCPEGRLCIEEIINGDRVYCYEQLHEEIPNNRTETVSEEVLDLFTVTDACGQVVSDFDGTIDVEKKNDDRPSIYQVDHPLELTGGWCEGTVACEDLTQFGEDKCLETSYCDWLPNYNEASCGGTLQCDVIGNVDDCEAVGCEWSSITDTCGNIPVDNCADLQDEDTCNDYSRAGCSWNIPNTCQGKPQKGNCWNYTKEQCNMVGEEVPESCQWINNCNEEFGNKIIKKLVIHNKAEPGKQWTDLEEEDIMIDKLAFYIEHEEDPSLWVYVYLEDETTPGYQPGQDKLVGKAPMIFGGPTIIEIKDTRNYFGPDWFTRGVGFDDQRQGGILIRAGDSRDFYIMLVNQDPQGPLTIPCGTYSAQFLYYQDYTGPDFTELGCGFPDPDGDGIIEVKNCGGNVRDMCINSDNYNWISLRPKGPGQQCPFNGPGLHFRRDSRNDDYRYITPDYGFGDVYIDDLRFDAGQAWTKQRDLTAERVYDWVTDVKPSGKICKYNDAEIEVTPQPEVINFQPQLATQVVLINHDGFDAKEASCEEEVNLDDTFLLNLQTADGFQNPHAKSLEVRLEYCLQWPHEIETENGELKYMPDFAEIFGEDYQDVDRCFNKEDLRKLISEKFEGYLDPVLYGDYFGEEFKAFIDDIFKDRTVEFLDVNGNPLPLLTGDDGKEYAVTYTDSNGQAQVRVRSASTGLYKIIANPLALDQDMTFVNFKAGFAESLDVIALPSFGVPADGEEEAILLLRAKDHCGNVVKGSIPDVTVSVASESGQATISRDFECKNNYDQDVTGDLYSNMFGFSRCPIQVMDDYTNETGEVATVTADSPLQFSDSTDIIFQGAPVKLAITSIMPSDRIPADGVCPMEVSPHHRHIRGHDDDDDEHDVCEEGEMATGAWVTVEVQDKNSHRVTGYKGKGFSGDPGDPYGITDFRFEDICIKFDDPNAYIPKKWWEENPVPDEFGSSSKFGWKNLHFAHRYTETGGRIYCGDLMFGKGMVYVAYENRDNNHGGSVNVKVYDESKYQCQEMNENNLPNSDLATQCEEAQGQIDYVDPATKWSASSNRMVVPADGNTKATITVKVENDFMAVRQAVEGTAQIDLDGVTLTWDGMSDALNPTSITFITDPETGMTTITASSDTPGTARLTITGGDAYVCRLKKMHKDFSNDLNGLNPDLLDPLKDEKYKDCVYSKRKDLQPTVIEIEFLAVADNQISLVSGWNFVSTNHKLAGGSDTVGTVFGGLVDVCFVWDEVGQSFAACNASTKIETLDGIWVHSPSGGIATLDYATVGVETPPQKDIVAGWNAVSQSLDNPLNTELAFISIDDAYTSLLDWLEDEQKYGFPVANTGELGGGAGPFKTGGVNAEPKQAYWVWATSASTLAGTSP